MPVKTKPAAEEVSAAVMTIEEAERIEQEAAEFEANLAQAREVKAAAEAAEAEEYRLQRLAGDLAEFEKLASELVAEQDKSVERFIAQAVQAKANQALRRDLEGVLLRISFYARQGEMPVRPAKVSNKLSNVGGDETVKARFAAAGVTLQDVALDF